MLELKNIVKDYKTGDTVVKALQGVDIEFREAEFAAILGHSGCGKTTLLNIIGGLDRYTSGDLIINGISTKEFKDADWDTYRNHSIGFVFQSYNLIPHQSVLSNVELALTLSGVKKAERRRRAKEALEKVGLGDQLNKKPNQMSGGQMQRVAIARAIVNDPDILLADEPTGALDSETSVQIMEILKELSKEKLIIMVTHNPELADQYASRIIRLSDGKVISDSAPAEASPDGAAALAFTVPAEQDGSQQEVTEGDETLQNVTESNETPQNVTETEEKTAAEDDGAQTKETENGKKPQKPAKKPSMSFFTALSLSLNNLMTKKGRTFLTAFAGSIGIIGIALILSLSTGIQTYIDKVQEDTLSSYPISIYTQETDLASMLATFSEEQKDSKHEKDAVYSNPTMQKLINSMNSETTKNDLKSFKTFLDKENNEKTSTTKLYEETKAISYTYNVPINAYTTDKDGKYVKSDIMGMFTQLAAGMSQNADSSESANSAASFSSLMSNSGSSSMQIWSQMLPGQDGELISPMLKEQYDVVAGNWPTDKNQVVLVLSRNNEVSDYTLYALGLKDMNQMVNDMRSIMKGEQINAETESWSYEEILGIRFRLITSSDYYMDSNGDGIWENISDNEDLLKMVIDNNSIELSVSGIIRPIEDASFAIIQSPVAYTQALTEYIMDKTNSSGVVKAQQLPENENFDVLSGNKFFIPTNMTGTEKVNAFRNYCSGLSAAEKRSLYTKMLSAMTDEEVSAAVTAQLAQYTTREEMEKAIFEMYAKAYGVDIKTISGMIDLSAMKDEEVLQMLSTAISAAVKAQNSGEDKINEIIQTPTQAELDGLVKSLIEQTKKMIAGMMPGNSGAPQSGEFAVTPGEKSGVISGAKTDALSGAENSAVFAMLSAMGEEKSAKIVLVATSYKKTTGMSEQAIYSYLMTLDDASLDKLVYDIAAETYVSSKVYEKTADEKVAASFDAYIASLTEQQLVSAHDKFIAISKTSIEDNLAKFGVADMGTPFSINIYAGTFDAKDRIAEIIAEYNDSVKEESKIKYTDYVAILMSSISEVINAISYILISFVSISLVVSSIMIGIITYISVLERTKEIGILRAIGASKKDISRVFNAETMIEGFISGLIGILVTVLLCIPINIIIHALTDIEEINAVLPPEAAVILVVISMCLTLIAGLIPAGLAAKKDPVEALRTE